MTDKPKKTRLTAGEKEMLALLNRLFEPGQMFEKWDIRAGGNRFTRAARTRILNKLQDKGHIRREPGAGLTLTGELP